MIDLEEIGFSQEEISRVRTIQNRLGRKPPNNWPRLNLENWESLEPRARLKRIRLGLGLSQFQLSELLWTSPHLIAEVEIGRRGANKIFRKKVNKFFGIHVI